MVGPALNPGGSSLPPWSPTSVEAFMLEKTFLEDVVRPLVRALVHSRLQTAGLAPGTAPNPTLQRDLLNIRDSLLENINTVGNVGTSAAAASAAAAAAAASAAAGPSSMSTPARGGVFARDPATSALINNAAAAAASIPAQADNSGGAGNDSDANMSIDGGPPGNMSQLSFDLSNLSKKWTPAQRKRSATRHRVCAGCGIPHNSKFRRGPTGPGTLCDKCGTKWKKITDQAKLESQFAAIAAGAPNPTANAGMGPSSMALDGPSRFHAGPPPSAGPQVSAHDAWHTPVGSRDHDHDHNQEQDNLDDGIDRLEAEAEAEAEANRHGESFAQAQSGPSHQQRSQHSPGPSGANGSGPGPSSGGSSSSSSSGHNAHSSLALGMNLSGSGGSGSSERSPHHSQQGRSTPRSGPAGSSSPALQPRGGPGSGSSNPHPPPPPPPPAPGATASPQQGAVSHAAAQAFLAAMHQRHGAYS